MPYQVLDPSSETLAAAGELQRRTNTGGACVDGLEQSAVLRIEARR